MTTPFARFWFCLALGFFFAGDSTAWAELGKQAANSCIECHRTLDEARLSNPVALWSGSVHASVGNTCDGCHGGNPRQTSMESMSKENNFHAAPEDGEITEFCGKCHREVADQFAKSQHTLTGTQNCVGCHGSHTIRRISIDIINPETCSECHDYERAEKVKNLLKGLHDMFYTAQNKLQGVTGFPTTPAKKELDGVWNKLRQVRMASHSFAVEELRPLADKVHVSLAETDKEIDRLLVMENERKIWGVAAVTIFSLLAIAAFRYNKLLA
jgi:hypothetical protein